MFYPAFGYKIFLTRDSGSFLMKIKLGFDYPTLKNKGDFLVNLFFADKKKWAVFKKPEKFIIDKGNPWH